MFEVLLLELVILQVAYPIRTAGFDAEMLNLEFPNTVGPFVSRNLERVQKTETEEQHFWTLLNLTGAILLNSQRGYGESQSLPSCLQRLLPITTSKKTGSQQ